MSQNYVDRIFGLICMAIGFCIGLFCSGLFLNKPIETHSFVSARLQECEDKGGRYGLVYSDTFKEYKDLCEVKSQYIDLTK